MEDALVTNDVAVAARALSRGEAVVFPTDTVCGLGVSVEAAESPRILFDIKERDEGKPIAWLVGGVEDLARYGKQVPESAFELSRRHWPGPLTLIVRAADTVAPAFRGSDGSIGLRMPDSPAALALIEAVGCPLATSSANIAGGVAPSCISDLDPRIASRASCVFAGFDAFDGVEGAADVCSDFSSCDGGKASARGKGSVSGQGEEAAIGCSGAGICSGAAASGQASTVISYMGDTPRIVREGAVSMEDLKAAETAVCAKQEGEGIVVREEFTFPSADGKSTIFARWWLPDGCAQDDESRVVVQLVHGMVEHIGRYDHFASYLTQQGFAVCAHDHIGHGRSVKHESDLGCLPPREGKEIMISDAHHLHQLAVERFPKAKHVMFGHSMGSFVLRAYLARHGEDLHAAVVCGTGNQPLALSKGGNALANLLCKVRGPRSTSSLIHNMAVGSYGKAVPNSRTPHDWISTDPAVVDAYAADPLCAYMFSVGGYAALTDLTAEVVTKQCADRVRKDLPLLYIAGAEDPVGDFGKGVYAAAKLVEDAGVDDVTTILYGGMRHEVLNECDKEQVYADVASWIRQRVE